jgi:hypothetical protein
MRATMTEIYEDHLHWIAFIAFLAAIKFLLGSAAFLFERSATTLAMGEEIVGILTLLAFSAAGFRFGVRTLRLQWSMSGPADLRRRGLVREDGFTFNAVRTAACFSLLLTCGSLWILDLIAPRLAIESQFFVKLPLFFSCASFSITYFILSRSAAEELASDEPA